MTENQQEAARKHFFLMGLEDELPRSFFDLVNRDEEFCDPVVRPDIKNWWRGEVEQMKRVHPELSDSKRRRVVLARLTLACRQVIKAKYLENIEEVTSS